MNLLAQAVTWIKVEKPTFDLVGVVLGSFRLAGVLLLAALVLGVVFGVALVIVRRRGSPRRVQGVVSLRLHSRG